MSNLCSYSMRIKGNKENVYEFYERMVNDDKPNNFCGIEAAKYDEYAQSVIKKKLKELEEKQ